MRNRSMLDFPRNEAGLVDEFIGTAYDAMYALYLNLAELLMTDTYAAQAKASQLAARASELAAALSETNASNSQKLAALNAAAAAQSLADAINARDAAEMHSINSLGNLHEVQANALQVNTDLIEVTRLAAQTAAIVLQSSVTPGANLVPRADAAGHLAMEWLPWEVARKSALDTLATKVTAAEDQIDDVADANTATQLELDNLELDIDGRFLNLTAKNDVTRGAALIGWDGQLLSDQLNLSKKFADVAALQAYKGPATYGQVLSLGIKGYFGRLTANSPTNPQDTLIVDGSNRTWKGLFNDLIPDVDIAFFLGDLTHRWKAAFIDELNSGKANVDAIELGALTPTVAQIRVLDAHTSGNNLDYDARLEFSGGTTTVGEGAVTVRASFINFDGILRTLTDLGASIGSATRRFTNVFAQSFRPGAGTVIWTSGNGTPETVVAAPVGSLFTRTDGDANTTLYVKETGTGNTGWVAK